ncbi:hypothetical protein WME99_01995 [Sorangium sp. So ce136]|uniref:hypothetical protein n=1 Tax=Sorangium sp. So ce136 TaxID=3133284 RepID=UPI003EFF1707
MITKQLKSLLMLPSPNALRPRSHAMPAKEAGAATPEAPAPRGPREAFVSRPTGEPAPRRAPEVPSFLRAAPVASGLAAPETAAPAVASMSLVPEGMRHFKLHGTEQSSHPPSGPALPFKGINASTPAGQPEAPHPPAKPAHPASLVPPGMRGFAELRGTQPASGTASTAPVLPFGLPAPPEPATPAGAVDVVPRGMRGFTSLTGTHPTSAAPADAPLPFSSSARAAPVPPPASPSVPALSLEQYATLCAELAASTGSAEALFARYGLIQPEARLTVDRFWRDRLARDPAAHQRWQELYWQHRSRSSLPGKRSHDPR